MRGIEYLLSSITDAVWSFDLSKNEFIYVNQRLAEIWNRPLDEIKRDPQKWRELLHPDDSEYYVEETQKIFRQPFVELEYRIVIGGKIKWIHSRLSKYNEGGEESDVLTGIISDITAKKETELKLMQSEELYRYLFANNPNPLWIYDRETLKFLAVNHAAVNSYGYTEEEFLSMSIVDIRPPEDVERMKQQVSLVKDGYQPSAYWRHIKKDGSVIWVDISGHGIDYEGHFAEIVLALDVSKRINAIEEIIRREKLLSSLIESQTNYLIRISPEGNFTYCNSPFLEKLHYTANELLGTHFNQTVPAHEINNCESAMQECLNDPGRVVKLVHQKIDRQGNLFWTSWEFKTITDSQEKIIELQGVGRDITEEVENKERIQITQNNLNSLINTTKDLIWSVDTNYKLIAANNPLIQIAKFFSGRDFSVGDFLLIPEFIEWKAYYDRCLQGEALTFTDKLTTKEGFILHAEFNFNPMFDSEGKIFGVGCFAHDISDRMRRQNQILDQNNRLREITSLASHDIRGPVASMLGLLH